MEGYVPDNQTYFATLPPEELIGALDYKAQSFYGFLEDSGFYYVLYRMYRAYYGANLGENLLDTDFVFDSAMIQRSGTAGQKLKLKINHYRALLKIARQLIISDKPEVACRASNTDTKSLAATYLGNALFDYYWDEEDLKGVFSDAVERALALTEGWIHCPWKTEMGDIYEEGEGVELRHGETEYETGTVLDVIRDPYNKGKHYWRMFRTTKSKFELAAKYPEQAEDILNVSHDSKDYQLSQSFGFNRSKVDNDEQIPLYIFYHERCEALPKGRIFVYTGDVWLEDGEMVYDHMPLYCIAPEKILDTPFHWSPAIDILGIQQGIDKLGSSIFTNNAAFSMQSIWTKKNDPVSTTKIGEGLQNIQSEEMPQPLQLTNTAKETFDFRRELGTEMETLLSISSTVRGKPEASLKSGSALALVVSQSIQFANVLESSYNTAISDVGYQTIFNIFSFAPGERIATMVGASNRTFQKTYNPKELAAIRRVVVERVNPLSKTFAGRIQLADNLLDKGMIKSMDQYLGFLTDGNTQRLTEGSRNETFAIQWENEQMRQGIAVEVMISDNHKMHYLDHKALLDAEGRRDPELAQIITQHMQMHHDLWAQASPTMLAITGQEPPPQGTGGQAPAQPQPGGGGNPEPAPIAEPVGQMGDPREGEQQPNTPNMPSLPEGTPAGAVDEYEQQLGGLI